MSTVTQDEAVAQDAAATRNSAVQQGKDKPKPGPRQIRGNPIAASDVKGDLAPLIAQLSNEVAKPGALTTEWWTVLIAGVLSAVIAFVGVSTSAAVQVAGILAPIVLALIYAFVRAHTKGALAGALGAVFPQASQTTGANTAAAAEGQGGATKA